MEPGREATAPPLHRSYLWARRWRGGSIGVVQDAANSETGRSLALWSQAGPI